MAEAKQTKTKAAGPVAALRQGLEGMIKAHESAGDDENSEEYLARQQCIVKADTVIKYIEARWPQ